MWKGLVAAGGLGVVLGIGLAWLAFHSPDASIEPPPEVPPRDTRADEPQPQPVAVPTRSLADIASVADDFQRNAALYVLIADAGVARIEELLGEVHTLPSTPHRYDIARILYIRFAALDPAAAADHVTQADHRPSWVEAVYRAWGHRDLDAAVAHAAALGRSTRSYAMRALFELELPDGDREAMASQLDGESMLAAMQRREELQRQDEDYASAWQSALALPGTNQRFEHLAMLAGDWAKKDPSAAMAAASYMERSQLAQAIQSLVLRSWAADDPWGATTWLAEQEPSLNLQQLTFTLMHVLSEQGLAQAISSLETMPQKLRRYAEQGIVFGLQRPDADVQAADLDILWNWYEELPTPSRKRLAGSLAMAIARHDPTRALDVVASLEGSARLEGMTSLMASVGTTDLPLAKQLVSEIEDAELRSVALQSVASVATVHDPRKALEWVNSLPLEDRSAAASPLFVQWTRDDPEEATRELLDLVPEEVRDGISGQVAFMLQYQGHGDLVERLFEGTDSADARSRIATALYHYFTETSPDKNKADRYREFIRP